MPTQFNSLFDLEPGMYNVPSLYNPNSIAKTPSAGIGSGNPVQSAQQKQQNMSQSMNTQSMGNGGNFGTGGQDFDWYDDVYGYNEGGLPEDTTTPTSTSLFDPTMSQGGLSPLELLQGYFPDIGDDILSQYTKFVTPLDDELYQSTLQDASIYQQMREEQTGFLQDQRGMGRRKVQDALFSGFEQARGYAGKRGLLSGRDFFSDISRQASYGGEDLNKLYSKGLYDINQNIVDRIGAAKLSYASLLGQQRGDVLRIAELADMFQLPEVT